VAFPSIILLCDFVKANGEVNGFDNPGITERIRGLVSRGYKPKDAIELILQEMQLEAWDRPDSVEAQRRKPRTFFGECERA
jgi:hypothetical protein